MRAVRWRSSILAAVLLGGSIPSHRLGAESANPCYVLSTDHGSVVFSCLLNPTLVIVSPGAYFDRLSGTGSEIFAQISDALFGKIAGYQDGKRAGVRDDKQAVIDLVKSAKSARQKRKLLADPTVRQFCLTNGTAAPLFTTRHPPDPGTDVTYSFSKVAGQTIDDSIVRDAIVDGLNQMNRVILEKLPRGTPRIVPAGPRDTPSILIRLGRPSEFKSDEQMAVEVKTKTATGAWKTGEISINPDTRIFKDKDYQGLSIAATHEAGHVYGMDHAQGGVMKAATSEEFDFFKFHQEITCMVAELYIYYDYLISRPSS